VPPPNNPQVARVALQVIRDARHFINTFHVSRTDNASLGVSDLSAINAVFADWWLNSYRTAVKSAIVGESITATKLDPSNPLQDTISIAAAGSYAGGGVLPADVSSAVSWRTGLAGRKYRGRFFNYGVPSDAANTNDTMNGAYLTILTGVGNYLLSHLLSAGFKAVIFHRGDNTATQVAGLVVDQLIDSMRNRLAGRGI